MYNAKLIADFIEKVNNEAEAAANKVFEKYEQEFINKVKGQMKKGDRLYLVNGSAFFENDTKESEAKENFANKIAHIQYLEQRATFNTYDFIK